ncbi:YciI family protein [Nostoc flagelliforme FACHB-838]|uniref:YciI family protein n=1 Tax=Nostoc flagelliforme FACHB-838 TaxID=2692904 RepID=A0ABR8E5T6_9NOSO|nr:YciI family protein [Nostoc flagelliforme]MBD2536660.1 YciI family protein [Nostoc flagelliforme FACHB-838]
MSKLFAVVVATVPAYYEYSKAHPEHGQAQLAWFHEQQEKGILLCCGPFFPHDGTGLWVIQAENEQAAQAIVNSSPRVRDGMFSDSTRVVEWQVNIGHERFQGGK